MKPSLSHEKMRAIILKVTREERIDRLNQALSQPLSLPDAVLRNCWRDFGVELPENQLEEDPDASR